MPRPLRYVPVPGTLIEVTSRTVQGRLLLPPTPSVNQAIVGVLGRAQRIYGMVVHLVVVLSNHYHLLLAPKDAKQLASFMGFVNSNIAREIGRLVDWKDKFWSRRYQAILVSDEVLAQMGRLKYFLANGVKEDLVEDPREWPGIHVAKALLDDQLLKGTWFDRTAFHRAKARWKLGEPPVSQMAFQTIETLELTPLPCLANLDGIEGRLEVECLVEEVAAAATAIRKTNGKLVLGARRAQAQHPHTQPDRPKKSPAPRFHAYATVVRKALREAYSAFVTAFRVAAEKLRAGDRGVLFPAGSFPPALPFSS